MFKFLDFIKLVYNTKVGLDQSDKAKLSFLADKKNALFLYDIAVYSDKGERKLRDSFLYSDYLKFNNKTLTELQTQKTIQFNTKSEYMNYFKTEGLLSNIQKTNILDKKAVIDDFGKAVKSSLQNINISLIKGRLLNPDVKTTCLIFLALNIYFYFMYGITVVNKVQMSEEDKKTLKVDIVFMLLRNWVITILMFVFTLLFNEIFAMKATLLEFFSKSTLDSKVFQNIEFKELATMYNRIASVPYLLVILYSTFNIYNKIMKSVRLKIQTGLFTFENIFTILLGIILIIAVIYILFQFFYEKDDNIEMN